jgi:hypothetical protein
MNNLAVKIILILLTFTPILTDVKSTFTVAIRKLYTDADQHDTDLKENYTDICGQLVEDLPLGFKFDYLGSNFHYCGNVNIKKFNLHKCRCMFVGQTCVKVLDLVEPKYTFDSDEIEIKDIKVTDFYKGWGLSCSKDTSKSRFEDSAKLVESSKDSFVFLE